MNYLILFLISFNVMAGWSPSCESGKKGFFRSAEKCKVRTGEPNCYKNSKGLSCEYMELADELVNDKSKPIYSKTSIEACSGQEGCESKLALKTCFRDNEGSGFIDKDYTETYCSILTGYQQKLSGSKVVIENPSLKSSYLTAKAISEATKNAIDSEVFDMQKGRRIYAAIKVMNKAKGLSKAVRKQLRKDLIEIRDDLFDGAVCDARADIAGLNTEGPVIKAADVAKALTFIDSVKTCP